MKSVVLIPIERGEKLDPKDRRRGQRRMAVPRRVKPERRGDERLPPPEQAGNRRLARDRRRLPDRRLGLKFDLDLAALE